MIYTNLNTVAISREGGGTECLQYLQFYFLKKRGSEVNLAK